ncbi:MAG: trypsin-like peptidase domain-containing protein [Planctomycetes bacterium]|nr:trypsin-like peptidase domain-containing protein [Planctomycetota bacterium]
MLHRTRRIASLTVVAFIAMLSASLAANLRETPLVRALRRAKATVVNIRSEKTALAGNTVFGSAKTRKINGMGTGIIIDSRGYIVTNHHVVDRVDSLRVTLFNGSTYRAKVVSFDRKHDLAIIRIHSNKPFPVMPMGTSCDLMLGESVFAVGNAFGYENTVTAGIISALSRDVVVNERQSYKNLIQTDASINPGNSGGPLINMAGEVIGINVAIRSGAQRIGFAIPIDDARRVMSRLLSIEKLDRHYHGLLTRDVKTEKRRELVVSSAESGSPAAKAGFKAGDVVVKAGQFPVTDSVDFERALLGRRVGDKVMVIVRRGGKEKTLPLLVGKLDRATVIRANNAVQHPGGSVSKTWRMLGLRMVKLQNADTRLMQSRYRGGMRVVDVRTGSTAESNGIRKGDILVGLHIWETVSTENISYVLNHPKFRTFSPLKFYILRGRNTLFGHLQISSGR